MYIPQLLIFFLFLFSPYSLLPMESDNPQPLSTNTLWQQVSDDIGKINELRKKIAINIENDDTPEIAEAHVVMKTACDNMVNSMRDMRYLIENITQDSSLPVDNKKKYIISILKGFDNQRLFEKLISLISPLDTLKIDHFTGIIMDPGIETGKLFGLLSKCNQEYSGENNSLLKLVKPAQLQAVGRDYLSNKFIQWIMNSEQIAEYCKYWSYCDQEQEFKYMIALHNYAHELIRADRYKSAIPLLQYLITFDHNGNCDQKKIINDAYVSLGQMHDETLYYKSPDGGYDAKLYAQEEEHIKPNRKTALHYYKKAKELDSLDVLADMMAYYYLSKHYDRAHAIAMEFLRCYESAINSHESEKNALLFQNKILETLFNENTRINFILGLMHLDDVQCPHSLDEAIHYIKVSNNNEYYDYSTLSRYISKNAMHRIDSYVKELKNNYETGFIEVDKEKKIENLKLIYTYARFFSEQDVDSRLSMAYGVADEGYPPAMFRIIDDAKIDKTIDEQKACHYAFRLLNYYSKDKEDPSYKDLANTLDDYCNKGMLRAQVFKMLLSACEGSITKYLDTYPTWNCSLDGKEDPGVLKWLENSTIQGTEKEVVSELSSLGQAKDIGARLFWGHFCCASLHNKYSLQKGLRYLEEVYEEIGDPILKEKWGKYIAQAYGLLVLDRMRTEFNATLGMEEIEKGLMYDSENIYCKTMHSIMLLNDTAQTNEIVKADAKKTLEKIIEGYNDKSKDENYANACFALGMYAYNSSHSKRDRFDGPGKSKKYSSKGQQKLIDSCERNKDRELTEQYLKLAISEGHYGAMKEYYNLYNSNQPIIEFIQLHKRNENSRIMVGDAYYLLAAKERSKLEKIEYLSEAIIYGNEDARTWLKNIDPNHKNVSYYKIPPKKFFDKIVFLIGFASNIIPNITDAEWKSGDYACVVRIIYDSIWSANKLGLNKYLCSDHAHVRMAINKLSAQINEKLDYLKKNELFDALKELINGLYVS